MARRIASFDWSDHPLGPLESWPQSLRTAVSLILNSRHPMWVGWGERMSFLYNDAYLHVLGLAKHPWALGRPAAEVWAEIWNVCGPLADKVFSNAEASFMDDVRLFMSRGDITEETFYSFSYSPILDESGTVAGLFCPSNDVTAKNVSARRSSTLTELAANGLVEKSPASACAAAAATLAKNPDDIPFAALYLTDGATCVLQQRVGGDAVARLVPAQVDLGAEHAEAIAHVIDEVIEKGRIQRVALVHAAAPPKGLLDLPVSEAVVLPIAARADARPLGLLVAGVNPTCRLDAEYSAFFDLVASTIGTAVQNARAAQDEKRRADLLAETDRAKTVFFSSVSHEFRTPLTLMLGPIDQIAQSVEGELRRLAETAKRNALRLLKLVNTLLEFSRLEAGRTDATFVPTDLAAFTTDIAGSFRSAMESAGLTFSVAASIDEPAFIDRSMWERILLNLLSNALKFTFEGGITVRVERDANFAVLRVSDTGVGIAPEELNSLFERFHRVRGARSRSHEGSGIGLALVHELVSLHGGRVDVESTPGKGTTFSVYVPLGSAHLDPAKLGESANAGYASAIEQYLADVDATMSPSLAPTATLLAACGARPRVLLADDNADLRSYVSSILAPRYDLTTVVNGREALEAARSASFDLIISDVMMPELDGFGFLRALRSDPAIAATPFILLSARAGEEAATEGLLEGADDYVTKPFSSEELLARVYAQISNAALRQRVTQQLRQSEERFRTLASSLPCIAFEAAPNGAMLFLSDEYAAYTASTTQDGLGAGWTHQLHPQDTAGVLGAWADALAGGTELHADVRLRDRDGRYRWFTARALPQRDLDGTILRWVGTLTDIHEQRQASREREILLRASELFASASSLDQTLNALAHFVVPELADWSQIHLPAEDGHMRTVALAHRDPEKEAFGQQFVGRVHLNPTANFATPRVARTGVAQLLTNVTRDIVAATTGNEGEADAYWSLGTTCAITVPMVAEGVTLGTLAVMYGDSGRTYSEDDVPLLEELARRAALAIHKAHLFEREHRAAESFQEASLPASLAQTPGLRLDAYYCPGRSEAQVGGDWYDAMRLLDGRVVISIGDVAGSGLQAAVTMGNMRQIIRGIAQVHADPALMLDAADRALRLEHADKFVTAFVAVYDPISSALTYASAGHPPPILRHRDGSVERLGTAGLPLGLRSSDERDRSRTIAFGAGSSLVLYTDGLTEFQRTPELHEQRLASVVAHESIVETELPARRIVDIMMDGAQARDDVAVLVATAHDASSHGLLQRWTFDTHDSKAAGEARHAFTSAFRKRGATEIDLAMAELVFGELVGNTVRYAPGRVEVIVDWSAPEPSLHVLDDGPGFRHISILPPELLSESGRGLFLVNTLTQEFRIAKRPEGGSHACAVLRRQCRDLVNSSMQALSGSLFYELTGPEQSF